METKKTYAKRVSLTDEQQNIILENYRMMSAGEIVALLQKDDPTKRFNEQTVYGFLRRVKREANKSYELLKKTNATEAAEKLKTEINHLIPNKRTESTQVIQSILDTILEKAVD